MPFPATGTHLSDEPLFFSRHRIQNMRFDGVDHFDRFAHYGNPIIKAARGHHMLGDSKKMAGQRITSMKIIEEPSIEMSLFQKLLRLLHIVHRLTLWIKAAAAATRKIGKGSLNTPTRKL